MYCDVSALLHSRYKQSGYLIHLSDVRGARVSSVGKVVGAWPEGCHTGYKKYCVNGTKKSVYM